jgi:hypothetical protein
MIIGWDVSTSAIGICVKDDAGKTLEFATLFPIGITHALKHRDAAYRVKCFIEKYLKIMHPDAKFVHVIEERLGGFTGGLTTKQTLMALAAMNAVISFVLADSGKVIHLAPVTTKRITGLIVPKGGNKKEEVIKLVRSREPTFPYFETKSGNYVKGTDDMADAWLLAEAMVMVNDGRATVGQSKKASSNKNKTRRPKSTVNPKG